MPLYYHWYYLINYCIFCRTSRPRRSTRAMVPLTSVVAANTHIAHSHNDTSQGAVHCFEVTPTRVFRGRGRGCSGGSGPYTMSFKVYCTTPATSMCADGEYHRDHSPEEPFDLWYVLNLWLSGPPPNTRYELFHLALAQMHTKSRRNLFLPLLNS